MKCKECGSEKVLILRHLFVNKDVHVKLMCEECFIQYHIGKEFMHLTVGWCSDNESHNQRLLRKQFMKNKRRNDCTQKTLAFL